MATKKEQNRIRHKRRERRNRWWKILGGVLGIGIQVFFLLTYFTHIPLYKPIDPADTVTVTAQITNTQFGEYSRGGGRHSTTKYYHYLKIHADFETFWIQGPRTKEKSAEYGTYNILALNDAIQAGDIITITYRKYYPWLVPQKYVVDLREGDQVYRSLDAHNKSVEGKLVSNSIGTAAAVLLTLPVTLFLLDVPMKIWDKVTKIRHEQYIAAKKAAKEAKAAEKAAKQNKTAPD